MVKHTVCREQNGLIRMKSLSVHNSNHTAGVEHQVFALESDLLCCHGHRVLRYQGIPALQTVPLSARE
jgi:hypothetical protein